MSAKAVAETSFLQRIQADQSATVSCPHCGLALLTMTQDALHTVSGKPWLVDGDVVPGVDSAVDSDRLICGGHEASLMVGACPRCKGAYWVAEATLANGTWDVVDAFLAGAEPFDQDAPIRTYVFASRNAASFLGDLEPFQLCGLQGRPLGSTWWLIEHATAVGPVHQHSFGPFVLQDVAELTGSAGVAACGTLAKAEPWRKARDLLLAAWPELVKIHDEATARTAH